MLEMLRSKYLLVLFLSVLGIISAFDNLALNKYAWQPSNYTTKQFPAYASAAVDGNRHQSALSGSCALSMKSRYTTWRVDLGKVMKIDHIDIYFRYDNFGFWEGTCKGRVAGFYLYISNTTNREDGHLCFHEIQNATHPVTPIVNIKCKQHGRYVIYYNERKSNVTYPSYYRHYLYNELCEVEVYGCENPGFYGPHCNYICPDNCNSTDCDIVNGACFLCKDGYKGDFCEQLCEDFFYGENCGLTCGRCFGGESCKHVDGVCENGCVAGMQGNLCNKLCDPGTYGKGCNQSCNENCNGTYNTCEFVTGECFNGCKPGWKGRKCDTDESVVQPQELCQSNNFMKEAIVGWVFSGILIVFMIIVLILYKLRKSELPKDNGQVYDDVKMDRRDESHMYSSMN